MKNAALISDDIMIIYDNNYYAYSGGTLYFYNSQDMLIDGKSFCSA